MKHSIKHQADDVITVNDNVNDQNDSNRQVSRASPKAAPRPDHFSRVPGSKTSTISHSYRVSYFSYF